jgi:hypothetical protein
MKNVAKVIGAIVVLATVAGCTPMQVKPLPQVQAGQEKASVLVYRETAFNAAGIEMIFGINDADLYPLHNANYATLTLPAGQHELFVRSNQADRPYRLTMTLAGGDAKCIRAYANPANVGKAFMPIAYYLGNSFLMNEVPCPTEETLKTMEKVEYVSAKQ